MLTLRSYGEPTWTTPPTETLYSYNTIAAYEPAPKTSYEEDRLQMATKSQQSIFAINTEFAPSIRGMQDIVDVNIGKPPSCWKVHKSLFTKNSPTAKAALGDGSKEGASQIMYFPEFGDDEFETYTTYLYTGGLNVKWKPIALLLRAYVMGDRLGSTRFLDLMFREIFARTHQTFLTLSGDQVCYIMENTVQASSLRSFCVDLVGSGILNGQFGFDDEAEHRVGTKVLPHNYKGEFLDGVLKALKLQKYEGKPVQLNLSSYLCQMPVNAIAVRHDEKKT